MEFRLIYDELASVFYIYKDDGTVISCIASVYKDKELAEFIVAALNAIPNNKENFRLDVC